MPALVLRWRRIGHGRGNCQGRWWRCRCGGCLDGRRRRAAHAVLPIPTLPAATSCLCRVRRPDLAGSGHSGHVLQRPSPPGGGRHAAIGRPNPGRGPPTGRGSWHLGALDCSARGKRGAPLVLRRRGRRGGRPGRGQPQRGRGGGQRVGSLAEASIQVESHDLEAPPHHSGAHPRGLVVEDQHSAPSALGQQLAAPHCVHVRVHAPRLGEHDLALHDGHPWRVRSRVCLLSGLGLASLLCRCPHTGGQGRRGDRLRRGTIWPGIEV
mmetsp:Transcript_10231/g.30302  ORF Transcript_10231/g.30302 Transcript_10231/m.30302 type:complete len:266 (-) Transcript_10231:483-1280(-)